ncbi:MAG: hypothetical protein JNL74_07530 [Fibrobacteres bacterium]|nr:hypothetical protein [Fibrobacterota bacterium]
MISKRVALEPYVVLLEDELSTHEMKRSKENLWQIDGAELLFSPTAQGNSIVLRASAKAVKRIECRWDIKIKTGTKFLGDHWERGYGDLEWRGIVPERVMPWYVMANFGQATEGFGVRTNPGAFAYWKVNSQFVTLVLDVRSGSNGVRLGQRPLSVATIVTREAKPNESAFTATTEFCKVMHDAPRRTALPVYGANDWYFRYGENSEATVLLDGSIVSELSTSSTNRPYMVIDDGWQRKTDWDDLDAGGEHINSNSKFPDMAALAGKLKAMGTHPGIWVRPITAQKDLSEKLLLKGRRKIMDPSIPEVLALITKNFQQLTQWGYELIKPDFTTFDLLGKWGKDMGADLAAGEWSFSDSSRTTAEIIRQLYQTLRDAAGQAVIIGCNTVGHLGAGLFEIQRTGNDTSGLEWEKTRRMGVNTLAFRMPQHDTFFTADADCVGLTKKISWQLNKEWLNLLAKSGTALFVSFEPEMIGSEQRKALKESFSLAAIPQQPIEPLDWMDNICPTEWRSETELISNNWFSLK